MSGSFLDTNVLVYAVFDEAGKAERAEQIIAGGGTISVQVLNEFTNVARRKMRLSWHETRGLLTTLRGLLSVVPVTVESHATGLILAERFSLSVYDAMIVAAASLSDCDTLWSGDMEDGLLIDGALRIVNPFRSQ
jgi:predicted nucleic acid-binding protein